MALREKSISDKSECISHATISIITDKEKESYRKDNWLNRKELCQSCGIEYHTYISAFCPLCEAKKYNAILTHKVLEMERELKVIKEISEINKEHIESTYKIGDVIIFGMREGQAMEWIVLKLENNRALILSKDILDIRPYNEKDEKTTWKMSSLRRYLNSEFIKECFTEEEKSKIEQVTIKNTDNKQHETEGGDDTRDSVFCLSIEEAKMFLNPIWSLAFATEYAKKQVGDDYIKYFFDEKTGGSDWWLRSPGESSNQAAYVSGKGEIDVGGIVVDDYVLGVRPALWLKFRS